MFRDPPPRRVVTGLDPVGRSAILLRVPKRREDRGAPAPMVPGDIDPANLRRRRPLTQRLSGAVLIAAAIVLYIVIRPALGF